MSLRGSIRLFNGFSTFVRFKDSLTGPDPRPLDPDALRARALVLAEEREPRGDRSELQDALADFQLSMDPATFPQIAAMLDFLADTLFRHVSRPTRAETKRQIVGYPGPVFFFVGHTSYYDHVLVPHLLRRIGLPVPLMHVAGTVCTGWLSRWLKGFRTLQVPKNLSPIQHRAYAWLCGALAETNEHQVLFARTSRYTVRARDGILREPYVPHGVISATKTTGRVLVVPVAVSYSVVPEDQYLTASTLFRTQPILPRNLSYFIPFLLRLRRPEKLFKGIEGAFGDVSVDLGDPFELTHDDRLTLQRISHRAIEEIARNKLIHPSHLVAKAMHELKRADVKTLRDQVERQIDSIRSFFRTRYRKEPPLHALLTSDVPEALQRGIKSLIARGAMGKSFLRKRYFAKNYTLLQFYGYQGDRRIYPLSGRNSMTVINAGVWGYTLALHIGKNLLQKEELAEHSLVLYDSREDLIEKLTVEGRHPWHFREIPLPRSVRPEADLIAAVSNTSLILIVAPSKYFHALIIKLLEIVPEGTHLVIATKGFIPETGLLPCQTTQLEMERVGKRVRIAALSGANLAHEIVNGGAGVTQVACEDFQTFKRLQTLIETGRFRVVYSDDVIGTSISAALKNVYAIGFGILEGSGRAPENFLATYSTLVTAEIRHFGLLLGASPETFDAESQVWIADLLATCRGGRSARFGRDLAVMEDKHGKSFPARLLLEQYRKKKVAIEGFEACRFAQRMASQRGFHPPILGEIYDILHGGKKIDVDGLIEKCLDALTHKGAYPAPSRIPHRSRRV